MTTQTQHDKSKNKILRMLMSDAVYIANKFYCQGMEKVSDCHQK